MKVVYQSLLTELNAAIKEADVKNKTIEFIELSSQEFSELRACLIAVGIRPARGASLYYNGILIKLA